MTTRAKKADQPKVGDSVSIAGAGGLMCLPGGTVVTVRADYVFRHVGEHVLTEENDDGETTETRYDVADPRPTADDD